MIGKSIVEGFRFAFSLKRMLPYVISNFLLLYMTFYMLGRVGSLTIQSSEAIQSLSPFFSLYLLIIVLFLVSQPLFFGVTMHQAKHFPKVKPVKESFRLSFSVYLKTLIMFLILCLSYTALGFVPYLWPFLMLVFLLAVYYSLPAAIGDNKKILESFKISFLNFKKYSLQTLVVFILVALIAIILIISSFIPLFFWMAGSVFNLVSQGVEDETILSYYLAQLMISPTLIPFLLIPAILIAFVSVMCFGVKARLYFNLKRKKI